MLQRAELRNKGPAVSHPSFRAQRAPCDQRLLLEDNLWCLEFPFPSNSGNGQGRDDATDGVESAAKLLFAGLRMQPFEEEPLAISKYVFAIHTAEIVRKSRPHFVVTSVGVHGKAETMRGNEEEFMQSHRRYDAAFLHRETEIVKSAFLAEDSEQVRQITTQGPAAFLAMMVKARKADEGVPGFGSP